MHKKPSTKKPKAKQGQWLANFQNDKNLKTPNPAPNWTQTLISVDAGISSVARPRLTTNGGLYEAPNTKNTSENASETF